MPLPSPPSSPHSTPRSAWFSLSRWFGGAGAAPELTRPHSAVGSEAAVEQLRVQARRRLIGAVVLLAAGVVAFPLVFETEPRPIGVDTPMQRVQGHVTGAGAPAAPLEALAAPTGDAPSVPAISADTGPGTPAAAPQAEAAPATSTANPALAAAAPEVPAVVAAPAPVRAPAPTPAPSPVTAPKTAANSSAEPDPTQRAEAQRARALLEGRSAVPTSTPATPATSAGPVLAARYVVQVGAFTEQRALAEARSRVERLGLKTYTQVISSPAGPRTRVRVGPFDSRAQAEAAGAKLRAAGLPAAILSL